MSKRSREHSSDEFGKQPLGSIRGLDAPNIGSPSNILIDGIVERESGATPGPPPFSVKTAAIALVVMFVVGLLLVAVALRLSKWADETTDRMDEVGLAPVVECQPARLQV